MDTEEGRCSQFGLTNLAEFIFYSISGGGRLPWFGLFVVAIRLAQQICSYLKIHFPIVMSLREYNTMLYLLELWYNRAFSMERTLERRLDKQNPLV